MAPINRLGRWKPTVPNIDENAWIICFVQAWDADQVGRYNIAVARDIQLVTVWVELGAIHTPSRVKGDNLMTDKVISRFETSRDGVVVPRVSGKHERGLFMFDLVSPEVVPGDAEGY